MPYPNSNILNIVIPQASASIDNGQAPFVERIISGSRLVLQTDTTGTLIGSSDLNVNNITASNITASGYISASNLYVRTNITDAGTLNVVGNSVLSTVFATNITASNISASGFISGSDGIFAGDVAVNGGDITTTSATATLFNTNATSVNIGGGATNTVLLGNGTGVVKTAGDFVLGINNAIKDTSGTLGLTVSSSLTTVAGDLRVGGNDIQDNSGVNNLTLSNTKVSVPLTTQATSFNNGALVVDGGVGTVSYTHLTLPTNREV